MKRHEHEEASEKPQGLLLFAAGLTALTFMAELGGGWWTNSVALLSDSGHVFMDLMALLFSFAALRLAERPISNRRTFGLHRLEVFAAFLNGVLVSVIAIGIVIESMLRLKSPPMVKTGPMLIIATGGLIVNLVVAWRLHDFSKRDINMRGAFLHVVGDALASVGVVAGGFLIRLTGRYVIDPIVGFFVAIIIVINAVRLLKDSIDILLEAVPKNMTLEEVVASMRSVPGVSQVEDTHIWNICSHLRSLSAHVTLPPEVRDRQETVTKELSLMLKERYGINHATIQIRFSDWEKFPKSPPDAGAHP